MRKRKPTPRKKAGHYSSAATRSSTQRRTVTRQRSAARNTNPYINQKKSHTKAKALVILLVLALGAFFAFKYWQGRDSQEIEKGNQITVSIDDGQGANGFADVLYDAKIIESKRDLINCIKQKGVGEKLKSGSYTFIAGQDISSIVDQLVEGPNSNLDKLTIAEGLTVNKCAGVIEDKLSIPKDDFLSQAKASNYEGEYPFLADAKEDSLEGYLYPKTYDFSGVKPDADKVIKAMLNQYKKEVADIDFDSKITKNKEQYGIEMSHYDILILASIIEREAATPADFKKISSVFYNRFKQDMPLQSDATTEYLVGRQVAKEDLQQDNPYNTYLNKGLPPTPICSPSKEAIEAALSPEATDYLYFFWDGSTNHFSKTYEEHKQAIADVN